MDRAALSQRGFTLLEVLVTVVVVSIGLLGLLGLQTVGLVSTQVSSMRSQASVMADNIADRMRANSAGAAAGFYGGVSHPADGPDPKQCENDTICSPEEMAVYDAWEWDRALGQTLPTGRGFIDCDNTACTNYRITIGWHERDRQAAKAGKTTDYCTSHDEVSRCFATVVRP